MAKVTTKQIANALAKHDGFQSFAADELGITRSAICQRIQKSQKLQDLLAQIKEKMLDVAERQLVKNAKDPSFKDNQRALEFYLRHQGKKRGYAEKTEFTLTPESKPLQIIYTDGSFKPDTSEEDDNADS